MRAAPHQQQQQQQQPLRFSLARGRGAGGLQLQPALQPFSALRAAGRGGYRTVPHTLSYDSGDDSDGSDGPPRLPRSRCGQSCLVVCVVVAVAAGSVAIFRALTHRDVPKVSSRLRGGRPPPPPPPRQFMAVRASPVVESGKRYGGKPINRVERVPWTRPEGEKRIEHIPLAEARAAPAPPFSPVLSWSWSPPPPPRATTTWTPASVPLPPLAPFPSPPPPPPRPARRHRSPPPPPPPLPSTLASVVGVAVAAEAGSGRAV